MDNNEAFMHELAETLKEIDLNQMTGPRGNILFLLRTFGMEIISCEFIPERITADGVTYVDGPRTNGLKLAAVINNDDKFSSLRFIDLLKLLKQWHENGDPDILITRLKG